MRNLVYLILIAMILTGCGAPKSNQSTAKLESPQAPSPSPTPKATPAPTPSPTSTPVTTPTPTPAPGKQRYLDKIFNSSDIVLNANLLYAQVTDNYGSHNLQLDTYSPPKSDTSTKRRAIIWIHGGNFQSGSRKQLAAYAREFAERGYVSVNISYRLLKANIPKPPPGVAEDAAQSDAHAAIRFVRKNAVAWGVDPDFIVTGGWSAGSITSFNVAYIENFVDDNKSNPGYTSDCTAVVGFDGMILTPSDFAVGDQPFVIFKADLSPDDSDPDYLQSLLTAATTLGIKNQLINLPKNTNHQSFTDPAFIPSIAAQAASFLFGL